MGFWFFFPKKVAATWWDFDFFFKKSGCYLLGFLFFFLRFWNLKSDFFPIQKVFCITANNKKITYFKPIMSEISANLKNIFREQKPPILKLEVGFFSDRKTFCRFFKIQKIYMLWTSSDKILSKIREPFWNPSTTIHHHHHPPSVTLKKNKEN